MRSLFLTLLLLAPQDDPVPDLVKRLTTGTDAERWKAVDELSALGDKAKPALEACEDKWWAGIALAEIAAREKAGDRYSGPVLITLEAKDRELRDLLLDLAAQAKIQIRPESLPEDGRKVTFKLERATWFEALAEIARVGDVDLKFERGGTYAVNSAPGKGPRSRVRSFEFFLTGVTRSTHSTFDSEPYSILTVGVALRGDPGSRILSSGYQAKMLEARDDTGKTLTKPKPRPSSSNHLVNRFWSEDAQTAEVVLDAPAEGAKTIALLRGEATVTIAKKRDSVRFDEVLGAADAAKEFGAITVTLQSCKAAGDAYEVHLKISSKQNLSGWPNTNDFKLSDSNGNDYSHAGSSASWGGREGTYKLTYRNPGGAGAPATFHFSLVTETYSRKVYFEFKDIPVK